MLSKLMGIKRHHTGHKGQHFPNEMSVEFCYYRVLLELLMK